MSPRSFKHDPFNRSVSGNLIALSRIPNPNGKNRRQLRTRKSTLSLLEEDLSSLPAC